MRSTLDKSKLMFPPFLRLKCTHADGRYLFDGVCLPGQETSSLFLSGFFLPLLSGRYIPSRQADSISLNSAISWGGMTHAKIEEGSGLTWFRDSSACDLTQNKCWRDLVQKKNKLRHWWHLKLLRYLNSFENFDKMFSVTYTNSYSWEFLGGNKVPPETKLEPRSSFNKSQLSTARSLLLCPGMSFLSLSLSQPS